MKFCSECAAPVHVTVPDGDHLPRYVCTACGTVHYQNPKIVVGCLPVYDGRLLLCKRAIAPRIGYWTIPAGFMENNETLQQGAARECWEEALARVEIGSLLAVVHVLHADQVQVMFRARLLAEPGSAPSFGAGPESLDVGLFRPEEIPWDEIAFESGRYALRQLLADPADGSEPLHYTTLDRRRPG